MGWKDYKDVLEEWYGYSEASEQDDIIIKIYNFQKEESYRMLMSDPWCHATVSAAAFQSGNKGRVPNTAYCQTGINWFKMYKSWTGRYDSQYAPQEGDIIYYDWDSDGISDHVGSVVGINGNTLQVREGNKNDTLMDRYIDKFSTLIMGYGRPKWDETIADTWVVKLQKECNRQGYSKQIVDGEAGSITLKGCPQLKKGARGNITMLMQEKLISMGYSCGNAGADGEFGNATQKAVIKLQQRNGLETDGIVGSKTWEVLLGLRF